jgi:hypothetical protein
MGPNNTKISSISVISWYLTLNNIVRILLLLLKNTKFDRETVSLLCVKTKSGGQQTENIIISNEETFLQAFAL